MCMGDTDAPNFWLLTHGYAMTADQVLHKFRDMDMTKHFYCSAEGLSHFYLQTGEGQIPVASWMTSRFRLDEIENYSLYLQKLMETHGRSKRCTLFGFSQGGTTLWRFINRMKPQFDVFINWGGDIPEDSEYDLEFLRNKKLYYIFGDKDQYITRARVQVLRERSKSFGLNLSFEQYSGTHKIDRKVLEELASRI